MARQFLLRPTATAIKCDEYDMTAESNVAVPVGTSVLPQALFNYIARKINANADSLTDNQRAALVLQDVANSYNRSIEWTLLNGNSGTIQPE